MAKELKILSLQTISLHAQHCFIILVTQKNNLRLYIMTTIFHYITARQGGLMMTRLADMRKGNNTGRIDQTIV